MYKPKPKKYLKNNYKTKFKTVRKKVKKKSKPVSKVYKQNKYQQILDFRNNLTRPELYIGNKEKNITLRSSYEIRFCSYLDIIGKFGDWEVIGWDSETTTFQYFYPYQIYRGMIVDSKKQYRTYFLDNYVKLKNVKTGKLLDWYCEIKPGCKTKEPKKSNAPSYPAQILEYRKNLAKWEAVEKFCKEQNEKGIKSEFKIITESFLAKLKFN